MVRLTIVLAAALLLLSLAFPSYAPDESHSFQSPWGVHEMDFNGSGIDDFIYHTTWALSIPAPSSRPTAVSIRLKSKYRYKYVVFNLSDQDLDFGFLEPTWETRVELDGQPLGEGHKQLDPIRVSLGPHEVFWGPGVPKAHTAIVQHRAVQGGWRDPGLETRWELTVVGLSKFGFSTSGAAMFGQTVQQRLVGTVTYSY